MSEFLSPDGLNQLRHPLQGRSATLTINGMQIHGQVKAATVTRGIDPDDVRVDLPRKDVIYHNPKDFTWTTTIQFETSTKLTPEDLFHDAD